MISVLEKKIDPAHTALIVIDVQNQSRKIREEAAIFKTLPPLLLTVQLQKISPGNLIRVPVEAGFLLMIPSRFSYFVLFQRTDLHGAVVVSVAILPVFPL